MKCVDVEMLVTDFYEGMLNKVQVNEIKAHLDSCNSCRNEYKEYERIVDGLSKLQIEGEMAERSGDDFRALMQGALADENHTEKVPVRKKINVGVMLTSACITAMFVLMAFTPVRAAVQSGFSYLSDLVLGDRGITNSLEKGLGQYVGKTDSKRNIDFTIHNFIHDENRSIALFSLRYTGDDDLDYDDISTYGFEVTSSGKNNIKGYSAQTVYDNNTKTLSGIMDLDEINRNARKLAFKIDTVALTSYRTVDIPLNDIVAGIPSEGFEIDVKNDIINRAVIKGINLSNNRLTVEMEAGFTDVKYMSTYINIHLKNNLEGSNVYNIVRSSSIAEGDPSSLIKHYTFDVTGLDMELAILSIGYNHPVKIVKGPWNVGFNINRNLAENSTMVNNVNADFQAAGYDMRITKVIFSPTAAMIEIECQNENPLAILGRLGIETQSGGVETHKSATLVQSEEYQYQNRKYTVQYVFDPVYEYNTPLFLVINGVRAPLDMGDEKYGNIDTPSPTIEYEDVNIRIPLN